MHMYIYIYIMHISQIRLLNKVELNMKLDSVW